MSLLSKFLLSKYPIQTWWTFLNVGSLGVGSAFLASIAFVYNWNDNPVFWRVFSPKNISIGPGDHHALIMLTFAVLFYATARKVNPLFTVLGIFFFVEAYEAEWYVTYVISKQIYGGQFEWAWMIIAINIIPIFIFYIRTFGVPWKFLGFMAPMFAAWLLIGFPITNDFPARTIYFWSIQVNSLEILTHIYAAVGFYLYVYPTLKAKSDGISMEWSKDLKEIQTFIRQRFSPRR